MSKVILVLIVAVTTFRYLASIGVLPPILIYVPELLSGLFAIYVIVRGAQSRFQYVRPVYWIVFGGLLVGLICGALVNELRPGPMFAGIRMHLRAIPLFFLPAVFLVNDRSLRIQLVLLLAVCAVQFPIAWYQRAETPTFVSYTGMEATTGDETHGTLMGSAHLSIFLISAACILMGFLIKARIAIGIFLIVFVWILLPTTINETKATFFLLPLGLLATVILGTDRQKRLRYSILSLAVIVGFLAIFVTIYDHFMLPRWGYGFLDFLTMEGRLEGYLRKGVEVGDIAKGGRVDSILAALKLISEDPVRLVFGVGIGNASDSALGSGFVGEYFDLFQNFPMPSINYILLEHGLLGTGLVLALHLLIFLDSLAVARMDRGRMGALAVGWIGVSVVMILAVFYHEPTTNLALSYLYWYFSGMIMAHRQRLEAETGRAAIRS